MPVVIAGWFLACASARAEDWPPVHAYAPLPDLAAAAAREDVPLAGITLARDPAGAHADDTVVLLVVLDERVRHTQWLVRLRGPRPAIERAAAPPRTTVLYGMDGRAIRFPGRRETYAILSLGPLVGAATAVATAPRGRDGVAPGETPARAATVTINAAFLDERFDRAASFMLRTGMARREGALRADEWFTVHPRPPSPPDAAARERFVAAAGLTDADERAIAATVPALGEFARVIAGTPGLREVLFAVVEKPSIWSVLTRFGRLETDFRFRSGEVVPSAEAPLGFAGIGRCFVVPFTFSINGEPALECSMLVTEPRPPLRMCGGIVAVVADVPGRSDVRLIVRVLASRPGGETVPPAR
ncbi:MAG: hypothetical protein IAE82_10925 [Opitutaceae bacterium]|nr:hypothetical protein [Opitutaceae bacterium]